MSGNLAKQLTEVLEQAEELRRLLKQKTEGCPHWKPELGGCAQGYDHLLEELEDFTDKPTVEEEVWCSDTGCPEEPVPYGVRISSMYLCPFHARKFAYRLLSEANRAERMTKRKTLGRG